MNLSREWLDRADKRFLLHGKKRQADVYVVTYEGCPVVVKDYGEKGLFTRLYGRYLLKRECRNYRFLQRFEFVPRLVGRIDGLAFAMEFIDGPTVADMEADPAYCHVPFQLAQCVNELHRNRFFHLDLRKRGNIMLRNGQVMLIDFASSLKFGRLNPLYWILCPLLKYVDRSAVIKWKHFICPDSLTDADRRFLRRFEWTRVLWFFNKPRLPKSSEDDDHGS